MKKKKLKKEQIISGGGLESAIRQIRERFGDGAIMKLGEGKRVDVDIIPTGSFTLDRALGVGGIPRGRIIEIYGPEMAGKTTLSLHIIAEAQKLKKGVAFIDAEHALDPEYAKRIGVKIDELNISQPNSGEQALQIAEILIKSGDVGLIVIDSVAALTPKAEIDGEIGDQQIGLQARLMSQALRKLTSLADQFNTSIIFVNQLRMKIGIMFGCIHGETKIPLARKIVKKIDKQDLVRGFDFKTKGWIDTEVAELLNNGTTNREDFLRITTDALDSKNGIFSAVLTKNHKVYTKRGWRKTRNLKKGDLLQCPYKSIINGTLRDFLNGTLIGDSHITIRSKNTGSIKFQDKNKKYIDWKIEKLSKFFKFKSVAKYRATEYTSENAIYKKDILNNERNPINFLRNEFSWIGLALWFMDDACYDGKRGHSRYVLSCKRFKNKNVLQQIKQCFIEMGLGCSINSKNGNISFTKKATDVIAKNIGCFVPENMWYKLPENYRDMYKEFSLANETRLEIGFVKVGSIEKIKNKTARNLTKYDLRVPSTGNFLVGGLDNGFLVHNSPEITPGGRALKFYASVRIDLRRIAQIKKGEDVIGSHIKATVSKNKVASPFKIAEFDILYNEGISKESEVIVESVKEEIIKKSGAFYYYDDKMIGQGIENARIYLKENKDVLNKVIKELNKKLDNKII